MFATTTISEELKRSYDSKKSRMTLFISVLKDDIRKPENYKFAPLIAYAIAQQYKFCHNQKKYSQWLLTAEFLEKRQKAKLERKTPWKVPKGGWYNYLLMCIHGYGLPKSGPWDEFDLIQLSKTAPELSVRSKALTYIYGDESADLFSPVVFDVKSCDREKMLDKAIILNPKNFEAHYQLYKLMDRKFKIADSAGKEGLEEKLRCALKREAAGRILGPECYPDYLYTIALGVPWEL